ncbi:MAG: hypothetical protein ISN28_12690 [Ectothiorhodospiraceae bacterium AqS1]|nr:hypothetical protein [Ectothiorhodospiraceae bacterium AqS1]
MSLPKDSGARSSFVPAAGQVMVNGIAANVRDGVAIFDDSEIAIAATEPAAIVLIDVP